MWSLQRITVAVSISLSASAWSGCSTAISEPAPEGAEYPIAVQKSGSFSRLGRSVRIVARDAATLAEVSLAEVPVDFSTQMALIAGLGPTPSSDLGIRITRVWLQGSHLRVQERQIHPGADEKTGFDPASPWTIAVIPRSDLNVEGYSTEVPRNLLSNRSVYGGGVPPTSQSVKPSKRGP